MVTRKIIKELDIFLTNGDHYPKTIGSGDNEALNRTVSDNWKNKIENGIIVDFKRILADDVGVKQKDSRFYIEDNGAQGATIWKSFITLTDKGEKMDVVINFLVNHDGAFIYLGTSHSNMDNYSGTSETLKGLFKLLKTKEKVGNFFYTKFYDLD